MVVGSERNPDRPTAHTLRRAPREVVLGRASTAHKNPAHKFRGLRMHKFQVFPMWEMLRIACVMQFKTLRPWGP